MKKVKLFVELIKESTKLALGNYDKAREFIEIAKHVNTSILSRVLEKIGSAELSFNYNGTEFHTFALPCECEEYKNELHLGGSDNV